MQHNSLQILELLAKAITGQPTDLSGIGDQEIMSAATRNGISPLLAKACHEGMLGGLSTTTAHSLNEASKAQASQDLVLNHDTRNLLQLLAEHDIPCLLLKGTPLSLLLYDQPYLRTRCDTDLYISEADIERTANLLAKNKYQVHNLGERTYSSKQFQASTCSFQNMHSAFDIHYRLSNRVLFRATLPFSECWNEKQSVPALGNQAQALSNRDLLIHACIHRIAHGRGTDRNRLIWLYDIHLLWHGMDEQEQQAFIEKALDKKIGTVCADALSICHSLFDSSRSGESLDPSSINIQALQKNRPQEPTAPLINASKPRWALADLAALPGLVPKLKFASELLFKK